jgi:hypothetical protein
MSKRNAKAASIAEWDALLARYPLASPWEMGRQLLSVAGSNAVVLYLLVTGRMRPFHLVALVALEALFLTAVAWIQSRLVPRSALMDKPQPLRARLATLAFAVVWLGFVYAIILGAMLGAGGEVLEAVRHPLATLRQDALLWPLTLTATLAVADSVRDWMHWRSVGGYFLSTPGFNSAARWLTLFLGGIPFVVPLAFGVFTIATLADRMGKRKRGGAAASANAAPTFAPFLAPVLVAVVFGVMGWLLNAGVSGWAVGYCSAKLASESFLVFLPLIASKARAEEAAGVGEGKAATTSSS